MSVKSFSRFQRGAVQIGAAQALVFVLALICVAVIVNVYQANRHAGRALPQSLPSSSRSQAALLQNVGLWRADLQKQDIVLSCPYLGHDYVARVDLPARRAVTLDAWTYSTETRVAVEAYLRFRGVRQSARLADPNGCMVHVFDASGEEVARASASGVITSQFAPIPGS